jgi:HEAT repeat protein
MARQRKVKNFIITAALFGVMVVLSFIAIKKQFVSGAPQTVHVAKTGSDSLLAAIASLNSSDAKNRVDAVRQIALSKRDITSAIPSLLSLLGDETPITINILAPKQGCPSCGVWIPERLVPRTIPLGEYVADILASLKKDVAPEFRKRLVDKNKSIRRRAIAALSKMGSPVPLEALTAFVNDEDLLTRLHVVEILGKSSDSVAASRQLISIVQKDTAHLVRIEALENLGKLHHPASLPFIIQQLHDPDTGMVYSAIFLLSHFAADTAKKELRKLTLCKNAQIKDWALEALGKKTRPVNNGNAGNVY